MHPLPSTLLLGSQEATATIVSPLEATLSPGVEERLKSFVTRVTVCQFHLS